MESKGKISGTVNFLDNNSSKFVGTFTISLYRTPFLSRIEFYEREPTYQQELNFSKNVKFEFSNIDFGSYIVAAYFTKLIDSKKIIDLDMPFGFFQFNESHSGPIFGIAQVSNNESTNVVINMKVVQRINYDIVSNRMKEKSDICGKLENKKGLHVLKLWGNPKQRGFAHGYLLAEQIIDFFRFYILEDRIQSIPKYKSKYSQFYEQNFKYHPEYIEEVNGIIEGMKASNVNMYIPELESNFSSTEIFAINGYIESRSACTQFVFLGESTKGSDFNGGILAGRNMDGEIDLRKVTVSHFIIFSVDPNFDLKNSKKFRWISFMWPGFVGTLSGVNEVGIYSMEDAGNLRAGPGSSNLTPCSWVMKEILEDASTLSLTPKYAKEKIDSYSGTVGGTTSAGSIIVFAKPSDGEAPHAFIYEGDRFGGDIRTPDIKKGYIHASNHFLKYNIENADPNSISFNSKWRYEVGFQTLESWRRTGKILGLEEMKRCLQMSCHGTTEHSIIFHPEKKQIWVAIASMRGDTAWDAPYLNWINFEFEELFI